MADINSRIEMPVTTGPLPGSRKIHIAGDLFPDIRVAMREVALEISAKEPPVRIYDTSGPYTDATASIDIAAGLPAMQEQSPDETITVDPTLFGVRRARPHHFWFLRVRGDSMIDAHILDGDLVALERREALPGDIIAALVDETDTTLKRLVRERGRLILRAANKRYSDIVPTRGLESQGVVVGLIRRFAAI